MRSAGLLLALLVALPSLAQISLAQQRPGAEGVLHLSDWPKSSLERSGLSELQINRTLGRFDLLPYIDTLTVGYRYEAAGDEPVLTLAIEWEPGQYGILDGRRIAYERMPDSLLLTALTIEADVISDGERVTEAVFHFDSLALASSPDLVQLTPASLSWDELFAHTPARAARSIFEKGFELRNLEIVSASFSSYDGDRDERIAGTYRTERRTPDRRTVYDGHRVTGILIDLGWLFPPPVWHPDHGEDRHGSPRGESMGRSNGSGEDRARGNSRRNGDGETADSGSSAERGSGGGSSGGESRRSTRERDSDAPKDKNSNDSSDDSDVDDEKKLLPAALTAAAAVGILAYKGGMIGYFGNSKLAPYGVSAGMVRPNGGFMLQAGVNDAVFGSTDGPQRLVGKILAFRQVLPIPIQPAIGAGFLVSYADDAYTYEPSFSVGALGNFGPVIIHSAFDVVLGGMEIGVAFNFRSRQR